VPFIECGIKKIILSSSCPPWRDILVIRAINAIILKRRCYHAQSLHARSGPGTLCLGGCMLTFTIHSFCYYSYEIIVKDDGHQQDKKEKTNLLGHLPFLYTDGFSYYHFY